MTDKSEKIALALEPQTQKFAFIPLMKALQENQVTDSWLEAKQITFDLAAIAPQVIWVDPSLLHALEKSLIDINIVAQVVSKEEAERISIENIPIRGTIDLHIRTRDSEIKPEMIEDLKTKRLISDYRKGNNANGIFHWKDDRWYQDFHLTIFRESDIAQINPLLSKYGYFIVQASSQ
jgi:hypothetical protein